MAFSDIRALFAAKGISVAKSCTSYQPRTKRSLGSPHDHSRREAVKRRAVRCRSVILLLLRMVVVQYHLWLVRVEVPWYPIPLIPQPVRLPDPHLLRHHVGVDPLLVLVPPMVMGQSHRRSLFAVMVMVRAMITQAHR